jgi:lipopolysaccharide biosynthesis protein
VNATQPTDTSPAPEIRAIAFYLPQFHPIPENDEWWGKGFTEWRNVTKARPRFPGHYQPHLPADLGFYDLRLPEVREAQADMARQHGIHGFCYYHYWFNGRRILERPFSEVLASGKPDFPFCLCWANENWTRRWDGYEAHVLLRQNYSAEDDANHIRSLIPALKDSRYIRVQGKPLVLIYRAELLPEPAATVGIWQREALDAGLPGLYLARVESYNSVAKGITAVDFGFDADVEFAPFSWRLGGRKFDHPLGRALTRLNLMPDAFRLHKVIDYSTMVKGMLSRQRPFGARFHCVTPGWDNSARREAGASIFHGSTPNLYENWLKTVVERTSVERSGDERIVFINAWNEWAEGNHLEPDLEWGDAYLRATLAGLSASGESSLSVRSCTKSQNFGTVHGQEDDSLGHASGYWRQAYWAMRRAIAELKEMTRFFSPPWKN